jgi:hypothetical protein
MGQAGTGHERGWPARKVAHSGAPEISGLPLEVEPGTVLILRGGSVGDSGRSSLLPDHFAHADTSFHGYFTDFSPGSVLQQLVDKPCSKHSMDDQFSQHSQDLRIREK